VLAVGQALARFLLLLVRQLQGAPAGRRAAFLGSPACSIAHQVLSEFSSGLGLQLPLWDVLVRGGAADAAALQQERYGPDGWKLCALSGEAVVQQVLLPGLLLVPAPAGSSSPDGGRSCWQATTTSTTSSSSSSVVVHSSIGSNTGSLACSSENCSSAGPPACSSSGSGDSHSVQCGPPDTAEDASSAHGCEVMLSLNMPLVGSLTEGGWGWTSLDAECAGASGFAGAGTAWTWIQRRGLCYIQHVSKQLEPWHVLLQCTWLHTTTCAPSCQPTDRKTQLHR
jgi:hypothetical protein